MKLFIKVNEALDQRHIAEQLSGEDIAFKHAEICLISLMNSLFETFQYLPRF